MAAAVRRDDPGDASAGVGGVWGLGGGGEGFLRAPETAIASRRRSVSLIQIKLSNHGRLYE